jgi:uncharacterized protein (DUF58 family)
VSPVRERPAGHDTSPPLAGFDEEFMRKLEYLALVSKRFSGQLKAERRARRLGSGLEFADYRGYVPGDDFRYLDWKTYLRLDRLLLRLYEEEQDLPIYMFVDSSQSMAYGDPTKIDYARRVAAALCYIGLANLDRVTVISYAAGIRSQLSPQRGKNQIFRVFQFLSDVKASGETDGKEAFKVFSTGNRRRGLAVVISDFLDPHGFEDGLNMLRYYKHDVFAMQIVAHEDLEPTMRGQVQLVDSESQESRELTITPELLRAYRQEMESYSEALQRHCLKYQLGYVRTVTRFPFEDLVLEVFRQGRFLK